MSDREDANQRVAGVDLAKLDGASRERLIKALAKFVLEDLQEDLRKQRQRKVRE